MNKCQRRTVTLMVMVVSALMWADGATAAESGDEPILAGPVEEGSATPSDRTFSGRTRGNRGAQFNALLASLDLDARQTAQVREIVADHAAQRQLASRATQRVQALLRRAREMEDEQAIETAQRKLHMLRDETPERIELLQRLEAALSHAQTDQLYRGALKMFAPPFVRPVQQLAEAIEAIDLTADQRRRVDAIVEVHRTASVKLMREHGVALRQAYDAAGRAKRAKNKQAIQAASQRLASLLRAYPEARPYPVRQRVEALLTEAQLEQMRRILRGKGSRGDRAEQLDL